MELDPDRRIPTRQAAAHVEPMTRSSAGQVDSGGRWPQLDGLRGLAILAVVLYHATEITYSDVLWVRAVLCLPWMGWAGVDLFFVLSGFLITRILLVHRGASNYFRAFYARRTLRIFPLYYSLLFLCLVVVPWLGLFADFDQLWLPDANKDAIWYWLFLGNFHAGLSGQFHHFVLRITWSLAIEEQFYLVWPWVVSRIRLETLIATCWFVFFASFCLRVVAIASGADWILTYTVTPFRLDGLAVGAWIAARSVSDGGFSSLAALNRRGLPWASGALVIVVGLLVLDPQFLAGQERFTLLGHPLMQTLGYSAIALVGGGLLLHLMSADEGAVSRRVFESWPLVMLGRVSFGLYLIHLPVILVVALHVYHPDDSDWFFAFEQLLYYLAVLGPSIGLAGLSWWGFESRILALRRHVPFRN